MEKKCTVPNCTNDAKFYEPIDNDLICESCLSHFKKSGIKTEYKDLNYPFVKSQPAKLWSTCSGANCDHPSHIKTK